MFVISILLEERSRAGDGGAENNGKKLRDTIFLQFLIKNNNMQIGQ